MDLVETIKNNFNKGFFGKAMQIDGLPAEFPAWTIKQSGWYGVAVRMDNYIEFSEHFSSARIWCSKDFIINNHESPYLFLTCSDVSLRNEFATICGEFVHTSEDGTQRHELISDPVKWWDSWKSLIGNTQTSQDTYSIIGELTVMEFLLLNGKKPIWSGIERASHDIELSDKDYEVKSTIRRYSYDVDISSIFQLSSGNKPLDLVFLRFEPTKHGRSLDDLVESLVSNGYSKKDLETSLERNNLERGCVARAKRYNLLETRVYHVDESFPAITPTSFVGGQLPPGITRFNYSVDLSGLQSYSSLFD